MTHLHDLQKTLIVEGFGCFFYLNKIVISAYHLCTKLSVKINISLSKFLHEYAKN